MSRKSKPRWRDLIWRLKGTLLILVVIMCGGLITARMTPSEHARLLSWLGFDYDLLTSRHIWQLLTGTWVQSTPGIELTMLALVFGGAGSLEIQVGALAMLLTCITGDWVSTVLTALTARVLTGFGDASLDSLLSTPDAGSSALAHAGFGAAVMLLPPRWLKIAVPFIVLLTVTQFFYVGTAAALAHCWATAYGALVGWFILRPRRERARSATAATTASSGDMLESRVV